MIWVPVFILSFLAFAVEAWCLGRNRSYQNRQGLTGAEVARCLLDAGGFSQMTVGFMTGDERPRRPSLKQLDLERSVYDGKSLVAIARVAREIALVTKTPPSIPPPDFKKQIWRTFRFVILAAWPSVLLVALCSPLRGLAGTGLTLFGIIFMLALLDLPEEWEARDRASALLGQLRYFEPDELARIKTLLAVLRFERAAQIFKAPFDLVAHGL